MYKVNQASYKIVKFVRNPNTYELMVCVNYTTTDKTQIAYFPLVFRNVE